jgi:hypothetical protein
MATSVQHPTQGLHARPTSRLTWLGLGLLLLSVASFIFTLDPSDVLASLLGERASRISGIVVNVILPAGIAAVLALLAGIMVRHERSVTGIGATIIAVSWILTATMLLVLDAQQGPLPPLSDAEWRWCTDENFTGQPVHFNQVVANAMEMGLGAPDMTPVDAYLNDMRHEALQDDDVFTNACQYTLRNPSP